MNFLFFQRKFSGPTKWVSSSIWAVITNYDRLKNNRNAFLTLEVGKVKIKVLADSVSSEGPLPGS